MSSFEAPIETHPGFVDFAGTPDAPLGGAIFRLEGDVYVFDRFGPEAPPTLRGVTSYLVACAISRRTSIQSGMPSAGGVGKKGTPPQTFGISGEWLKVGVSAEKRGNVYTVREEWKASGPGGWSTEIYSF